MIDYNNDISINRAMAGIDAWCKKNAISECLEKNQECTPGVIKSHSIQNRRVLELLVDAGHVHMIQPSSSGVRFEKVGRNKATTFTGYCGFHDNSIFAPIDFGDDRIFDIENNAQLSLLTLRAIAKEYWAS